MGFLAMVVSGSKTAKPKLTKAEKTFARKKEIRHQKTLKSARQLAETKEKSAKAFKKLKGLKTDTLQIKKIYETNVLRLRKKWRAKMLALSAKSVVQSRKLRKNVAQEKKAKKQIHKVKAQDKKVQHIISGQSHSLAAAQATI